MYRATEKSARPKAIFLPRLPTAYMKSYGKLKCEYLLVLADRVYRQDYVFVQTNETTCFTHSAEVIYSAKFLIYEKSMTLPLLIPCVACNPIVFSKLKSHTLPGIRKAWDVLNSNMHNQLAFVEHSIDATCGLVHTGFVNLDDPYYCYTAAFAEKHNLTLVDVNTKSDYSSGVKNFGIALCGQANSVYPDQHVYKVRIEPFNFVTLTNPATSASGMATRVSPFDQETWICLLVSAVLVAGYLAWVNWCGVKKDSHRGLAKILVIGILLGQPSGDSGNVDMVTLIFWLFGNFFLMMNLYQGLIYSCMAVLIPPQTPRGLDELLTWKIPMVAVDGGEDVSGTYHTYLTEFVIPKTNSGNGWNQQFTDSYTTLQERVLSIGTISVETMLQKIMSENTTRKHESIALFVSQRGLENYVKMVHLLGNRNTVRNKEDTPLQMVVYHVGPQNLLVSYFSKEWERIEASGLNQVWLEMFLINYWLRKKWLTKQGKYFEAVRHFFGNLREPVTFHEAISITLELIFPVFSLCAVGMVFGVLGFLVECRKFVVPLVKNLVRGITNGMRFVWKILKIHSGRHTLFKRGEAAISSVVLKVELELETFFGVRVCKILDQYRMFVNWG